MTDHKQLTINRIGGGKTSSPVKGYSLVGIFIMLVMMLLAGCKPCEQRSLCGVEIGGTPWELAARIADSGDGSFVPECVRLVTTDKAYIDGWVLGEDERPATLVCDVRDGKVVEAVLLDEIME